MLSTKCAKKPILNRFAEKIILVTGGTNGIGEGIVKRFHAEGGIICFTGRNKEKGEKIMEELNEIKSESCLFISCDHSKEEENKRVVEEVCKKYKTIDVLINNAGKVVVASFEETDYEQYKDIMRNNVDSVWNMCSYVIPVMLEKNKKRGGVVVNIASDWGLTPSAKAPAYCMSKSAVISLSKSLALQYAKRDIRVLAVCPGNTFVERWKKEARESGEFPESLFGEKALEEALRVDTEIPMGRVGEVEEVAGVVAFVCSEDASYMTGCCVSVDGGSACK